MKLKVSKYVADSIKRSKSDFTVQTFKAGGKGGQYQNKTESGVRIIDKITGLSAECREERSQIQNKHRAFLRLVDLLVEFYKCEEVHETFTNKEVVRVYRPKSNEVKDFRGSGVAFDYSDTLDGDLEDMIEDVQLNGDI